MDKKMQISNRTAYQLRESITRNDFNGILNSLSRAYNEIYIKTEDVYARKSHSVLNSVLRENNSISAKMLNKKLDEFWNYCDFKNIWVPVSGKAMQESVLKEADEDDGYMNSFGYDDRNEEKLSGDVEKDFDKLIQALRDVPYTGLGDALDKICNDPKLYNLLKLGFGDGELAEVTMGVNDKDMGVKRLFPTQNEIGLDASLKYALAGKCSIDSYFTKPALAQLSPIVTFNGTFIIDGHHRWSQVYIINPNATMKAVNFTYRDQNPVLMLRNMQGSIAVANKGIEKHYSNVANLFAMTESEISKYIEDNIVDSCVEGLAKYKVCKDKNGAVEYLTKNAMQLKDQNPPIKDAPNREYMPQTDDKSIEVAADGQTNI